MRIPLMLVPLDAAQKLTHKLRGLFGRFLILFPGLKYDLVQADMKMPANSYLAVCFFNAFFWGILVSGLIFSLQVSVVKVPFNEALRASTPGAVLFLIFFLYFISYPKIYAKKIAQSVDKDLIFALKDLLLQVSVGVPLYNAMINVSRAQYGTVSSEFAEAVREVRVGISMEKALEHMAIRTKSEFLKKAVWQLRNGWKAGASLKGILQALVMDLTANKRHLIKSYGQELNLWVLIYLLFAVVAPTIGATLLVVLSAMSGSSVTPITFGMLVASSVFVQIFLIGFVKSRRPVVAA